MFMEKHFMPRNKGIARNYPVHIFMDRPTGKSQDAWLEMPDQATHNYVMRQYNAAVAARKIPKIASKPVDLISCTQGKMMAAFFPNAKDIYWDPQTGIPIKVKLEDGKEENPFGTGFRGFITKEELYCVRMHTENPARVSISPLLTKAKC